ncbi:MAG: methionyl-tRNA formyltransferase [Bacteroidota bacterium]
MKVVFMGTPQFAAWQLQYLIEHGIEVVAVVTMPDKPMGRGMKLGQSAVKETALKFGLPVLQPVKLKEETFLQELQSFAADVFVVVAFRMLPTVVWAMPPKGTLNLHASLLPQYRGAAPINHAIINGETRTGVTTFFIQEEIDTGDILLRDEVEISPEDDAGSLHDKLMETGGGTILATLRAIDQGTVTAVPQEGMEEEMKSAPKIFKEDCRIDWNRSSETALNLVRGMSPYPAAWTQVQLAGGKQLQLKIFKAKPASGKGEPGSSSFIDRNEWLIGTADGLISLTDVQLEGKKRMDIRSFLMGFDTKSVEKVV